MDSDSKLIKLIQKRFGTFTIGNEVCVHIPADAWNKYLVHVNDDLTSSTTVSETPVSSATKTLEVMGDRKSGPITIFTDGGCTNNGGKNPVASWAYVVFDGKYEIHRESSKVVLGEYGDELPSNNRGELTAILRALEYVDKHKCQNVTLYSDSLITVSTINEWYDTWVAKGIANKKANPKLIGAIMSLYKKLNNYNISVVHCKAHQSRPSTDDPSYMIWYGNDICDKLCGALLN